MDGNIYRFYLIRIKLHHQINLMNNLGSQKPENEEAAELHLLPLNKDKTSKKEKLG